MNFSIDKLFDLNELDGRNIFDGLEYPWEALERIKSFLLEYGKSLPKDFERVEEFIWVGKGTTIERTAVIKGPAIIGYNCEIRNSAYIRENVLVGNNVVIGNSTEIKNSILFNNVQVPHYNYVGDSILGYKAHLGAGVILSNVKSNGELVKIKHGSVIINTDLRKLGGILGDFVEVGCNSVLNPGTVIGKESIVYPLTSVRGCLPERCILKGSGEIVDRK